MRYLGLYLIVYLLTLCSGDFTSQVSSQSSANWQTFPRELWKQLPGGFAGWFELMPIPLWSHIPNVPPHGALAYSIHVSHFADRSTAFP